MDQEKTTFTCPFGTYTYRRMPFDLCNAPTFQRCMLAIFHDMIEESVEVFMNDFSVFGSSFDHFLNNLDKMLQCCKDTHLFLNRKRCHFMVKEGIVLGHKVSEAGLEVDKAIALISKLPPPTNIKALRHLFKKQDAKPRLIRWIMLLQEFDIKIKNRKGTENVASSHLSRIKDEETSDDSKVDNIFPRETLMEINTKDEPWFADFTNYLASDIIPKGMTYQQKNKLFSDIKHYFLEEPYVFKHKVCACSLEVTPSSKEIKIQVFSIIGKQARRKENLKAEKGVYKAGKRLLYINRNKAISLGKGSSKVCIEIQQLSLKDCTWDQQIRRNKWDNDDYVCRGLILKGMSDPLFDIYQNVKSGKELSDSLEAKYMVVDASSKKFLVSNFINYKMIDSRPIMEQYNELIDFKHTLKHNKDELILVELGSHLRIEESYGKQDSDKLKGNNVAGLQLGHVHFKRMQDMYKDGLIPAFDIDTKKCKVLADLPPGFKPLGYKWIFKIKLKVDGTIEKFKAGLVIQGFRQKLGIDYFDTYTLVARINTIRLRNAMVSIHNLIIHQMDMKIAFLNGKLEEEVYMNRHQGFIMSGNENKVCKLIKSLYRLKHAPKQLHQKFDEVALSSGYLLNQLDKCVYSKFNGTGKGVIIFLYVDDMLIFGTDQV
nr:zinc finger, CCHC-type [Tanacetum cinerariifolium]